MNQDCVNVANNSPIRAAIYQNQDRISHLSELISQLEKRLSPVLAPGEPSTQKNVDGDSPTPPMTEYEAILRDQTAQMYLLDYRLNNLLTCLAI